ncbi:MAG: hypothetical protein GX219_05015 [Tissierellia bacterium]|nr:hypothetical protein [Tissierellia bacterium]
MRNFKRILATVMLLLLLISAPLQAAGEYYISSSDEIVKKISEAINNFESQVRFTYPPALYEQVYQGINNYHDTVSEYNDYERFLGQILGGNSYPSGYSVIQMTQLHTKAQDDNMRREISQNIAQMKLVGLSPYEKVKRVHDRIILETTYDLNYNSPVHIIESGRGLCQSYAMLFYNYMKELGVPVRIVHGDAYDSLNNRKVSHAWNLVQLDGQWYNIDLTYDDPIFDSGSADFKNLVSYEFFLVPNSSMSGTHFPEKGFPIAVAPARNGGIGVQNPVAPSGYYYTGYGKIYTEEEKYDLFNGAGLPDVPIDPDPPVDPDPPKSDSEIIQDIIRDFGLVNTDIWSKKTAPYDKYSWTIRFNKPIATAGYTLEDFADKFIITRDIGTEEIKKKYDVLDGGRAIRITILPESDPYVLGKTYFVVVKQGVLARDGTNLNNSIIMPFVFNGN